MAESLTAGITRDRAFELLNEHNKDPFHITHGETVEGTMRYFAREFDPENEEFWGIVGLDPETGESQWYNYNDCVSLEDWAVLDRLLAKRFGWMEKMDPGLVYETKVLAKAQLAEG